MLDSDQVVVVGAAPSFRNVGGCLDWQREGQRLYEHGFAGFGHCLKLYEEWV